MDDIPDSPVDRVSRVSASWVFWVLRRRFGCIDMGWRDETAWYWVTPNGVEFTVADPSAGLNGANAKGAGHEPGFPRAYARELIGRIREILKG